MTALVDHIRRIDGQDFSVKSGDSLPPDLVRKLTDGRTGQLTIDSVTSDSRRVTPGALFCAIPGAITDGRNFISQAADKGAKAILAPTGTEWPALSDTVARLEADEPRQVLALAAAALYGRQPRHMAAVTGTSGKTSTALFTQQLLSLFGHKSGSLGTLGLRADGFPETEALTTPAPEDLHKLLADIAKAGVEHCAMEASSHGLDQHRLDGVRIQAAGFTNLGRDHLDYHADAEDYFAAKARLFSDLLAVDGTAIINADSDRAPALRKIAAKRGITVVDYGYAARDLKLLKATPHTTSIALDLAIRGTEYSISVPLVGAFQAHNVLCALGMAMALDPTVRVAAALNACTRLKGAPGRMDHVATDVTSGAPIFVDYAHKPDALEAVLTALRPHTENNLVVVFGCGGDRDKGKRPQMGEIAERLADKVFVTDDNPRSEDPAKVRADILVKCRNATEIGDRREAIATAIRDLLPGDTLVIAGKGHETGQKIGDEILPFNDTTTAQEMAGEQRP